MFFKIILTITIICGTIMGQEYKKVGVLSFEDGEPTYHIPWYVAKVDYNAICTGEIFSKIICPQQTKCAYVGYYKEIEWCEHDGDNNYTIATDGISFLQNDNFIVSPGPSDVYLRWWFYSQQEGDKMKFIKGRNYIFCLSRFPKEQWRTISNKPGCDLDRELPYVNAIIELEPTFDFTQQNKPKQPLFICQDNLLSFSSDEFLVKRNKNFFYIEVKGKTIIAPLLFLKKFFYAINACQWTKKKNPQKFNFSSTATVEYTHNGKRKKTILKYVNGSWVMTMNGVQYMSDYLYLMYSLMSEVKGFFEEK
ncbi:hypothetical protein [Candidatus Uabimicrobium sp. HlEnr_7]|uniref:hypothetical protein n=1 Tax=Candidatus Uabimicrobium helgolandensis TaxID=3095367 RepID=UPI0035581D00